MAKVHNWQIGREMDYPYPQAFPRQQFAFVFNINRCIACQSCTMACKSTWTFNKGQEHMWWANVETKPYGGYPQFWDAKILDLLEQANPGNQQWSGKPSNDKNQPYGQFDGKTIFEAQNMVTPDSARVLGYLPTDEEWNLPNIFEDNPVGKMGVRNEIDKEGAALPEHKTWFFYLARICNHCSYPYNIVMMKHAPFIATEKSVKAHETRPDGRALSANTGYQANLRYGSQQSITRNWHMPMHQTDTLFHKTKAFMGFIFGGEADNHAVNTVPKETLVRITKAEDGGIGGEGIWKPATTGHSPDNENDLMKRYLAGDLTKVKT